MSAHGSENTEYQDALAHLDTFTNYEKVRNPDTTIMLELERMGKLLDRLGHPERDFDTIHIAGTKGKGSTCCLTAALLRSTGRKTGLYTSPHIESIRERVAVDGQRISREDFVSAFTTIKPHLEDMAKESPEARPTYFETITALAFVAFRKAGVEVAVIEVGLGGRFDATNIINPTVTAITPVSLDHTAILGDSISEIAAEKAGIIKHGVPLLLAPQSPEANGVFYDKAVVQCAPIRQVGGENLKGDIKNIKSGKRPKPVTELDITSWRGNYNDISLPLIGRHQAENAVLAVGLVETYLELNNLAPLTAKIINRAWRTLIIPGRVELVSTHPWTILDGAHNAASIWALSETISNHFPLKGRKILVFGAAEDKKVHVMLRILAPMTDVLIATSSNNSRSMDITEISRLAQASDIDEVYCENDPEEAIARARAMAGDHDLICVTGSFYLVGAVRRGLLPNPQQTSII